MLRDLAKYGCFPVAAILLLIGVVVPAFFQSDTFGTFITSFVGTVCLIGFIYFGLPTMLGVMLASDKNNRYRSPVRNGLLSAFIGGSVLMFFFTMLTSQYATSAPGEWLSAWWQWCSLGFVVGGIAAAVTTLFHHSRRFVSTQVGPRLNKSTTNPAEPE